MKSHRDIGRHRGPTPRDSGRGEGSPARLPFAGRAAGVGAGVWPAGNRCEKAIVFTGVLGLPEIRVWLARPGPGRSPHEMPLPLTSITPEFG